MRASHARDLLSRPGSPHELLNSFIDKAVSNFPFNHVAIDHRGEQNDTHRFRVSACQRPGFLALLDQLIPQRQRPKYGAMSAYARSKLANLLFTAELQRRLDEANSPGLAMAAHPGVASTNLLRPSGQRPRFERLLECFTQLLT